MVKTLQAKNLSLYDLEKKFNLTLANPLPSLLDKLTSLRGYSQRKIKVVPQIDGRALKSRLPQFRWEHS